MDKKISGLTEAFEFDNLTLFPAAAEGSTVAISPATVVGPLSISYNNLKAKVTAKTLVPGRHYRITSNTSVRNHPALSGDIVVRALTTDSFALQANQVAYVPDYNNNGNYEGVQAHTSIAVGTWQGQWQPVTAVLTVSSISGFQVGEMITLPNGNGAFITKIETGKLHVSRMAKSFTSGTVQGSRSNASATASSADFSDYLSSYPLAQGDIVIYAGFHFQKKKTLSEVAFDPDTDNTAWTALLPASLTYGYKQETDAVEYNFANDTLLARKDRRGNEVRVDLGSSDEGKYCIMLFRWGDDNCSGNYLHNARLINSFNNRVVKNSIVKPSLSTAVITFDQSPLLDSTYLDRVAGMFPNPATILEAYLKVLTPSQSGSTIQIESEENPSAILLPSTAPDTLPVISKLSFTPFRVVNPFGSGLRIRKLSGTSVSGSFQVIVTFLIER